MGRSKLTGKYAKKHHKNNKNCVGCMSGDHKCQRCGVSIEHMQSRTYCRKCPYEVRKEQARKASRLKRYGSINAICRCRCCNKEITLDSPFRSSLEYCSHDCTLKWHEIKKIVRGLDTAKRSVENHMMNLVQKYGITGEEAYEIVNRPKRRRVK